MNAFTLTPMGQLAGRVRRVMDLLSAFVVAYKRAPNAPAEDSGEPIQKTLRSWWLQDLSGGVSGRVAGILDWIDRFSLPPFPALPAASVPTLPSLPDLGVIQRAHPLPSVPDTGRLIDELAAGAWAKQRILPTPPELLRSPASVFASEQRRLEAAAPLPSFRMDDVRLRDLIYIAVGRILPPALRTYAPDLRALFDRIDEGVYRAKPLTNEQRAAQPQLLLPTPDLADSGKLRPVIGNLRFVAPQGRGFPSPSFPRPGARSGPGTVYFVPAAAQ